MFHGHLDYFQKPPFGGRPKLTQNRETMALRMLTTVGFIVFYHVRGPAWIKIHWISIWLRVRSHMTSHYRWGFVTTLHGFGSVFGRPLDTFFWALTISWSRLLACVWSGPKLRYRGRVLFGYFFLFAPTSHRILMKRVISARCLADPDHACCHIPHIFPKLK